MNTSQIRKALGTHPITRDVFVNVLPRDQLPAIIPFRPCSFVINTDPSDQPGQHWVAAYFGGDNDEVDYFDSYGHVPPPVIGQFLSTNSRRVNCNQKQVQGYLSSVCGQFCIYFSVKRAAGSPLHAIVQPFCGNFVGDSCVTAWVNKRFRLQTEAFEDSVVVNQMCKAFGV